MERIKVLIEIPFFIKNYNDFVLTDALNAIDYNFMEVISRLGILQEVEEFFGKGLEKYTAVEQFEKIIEDMLTGTKPEQYESLLMKLHQNLLFPDHILILNPEHMEKKLHKELCSILSEELKIFTAGDKDAKKPDKKKYRQVSGIIQDFCNGKKGVYCFILLHPSDFLIIEKERLRHIFNNSQKGILAK